MNFKAFQKLRKAHKKSKVKLRMKINKEYRKKQILKSFLISSLQLKVHRLKRKMVLSQLKNKKRKKNCSKKV